jgi:NAD(P)-dependent dehydrogenase (short-subunit alcohol dehydrogenase family)
MTAHDLLKDRTIIVTGAATGIGQAFALGCVAQGANVVVADMNAADETVALIEAAGGQALAQRVDVADDASVRAMADAALRPSAASTASSTTRPTSAKSSSRRSRSSTRHSGTASSPST